MAARKYQTDIIALASEKVSREKKILIQLPTGGGKTYIFSLIAQRFHVNTRSSVLIVVHREELMYQAEKTIKALTGISPCLVTAKTKKYQVSPIYIGMVESVISRTHLIEDIGLLIIDECHVANFNKIHSIFSSQYILGFSATPISSSKKEPMNKYYSSIVSGPQINELIKDGFLSQNITRCPKDVVDSTKFEIDRLKGDFNESAMAKEYSKTVNITNVVQVYQKYCLGKKTIIFNVNIEHSLEVTRCFNFCGFETKHVDANSKDRKEILQWFSETDNAILCNVGIATVGFDEPGINNVILNFSTLSLPKFIQCAGRGGRIVEGSKYSFNLIDMGGNCIRFGDWSDERDWVELFNNPAKLNEGGVAPVKTCPNCEGLVHASASVCGLKMYDGSDCWHIFDRRKAELDKSLGDMVLITKGIDVKQLEAKFANKYDYYTFDKMCELVIDNLFEKYRNPSNVQRDSAFRIYYDKCIEWFANKFEGKQDISTSTFHINKATYNFDKYYEYAKVKYNGTSYEYSICNVCGDECEENCTYCEYPVCNSCKSDVDVNEVVCVNCSYNCR
jgi:superfamily II DNA or RNA helicase